MGTSEPEPKPLARHCCATPFLLLCNCSYFSIRSLCSLAKPPLCLGPPVERVGENPSSLSPAPLSILQETTIVKAETKTGEERKGAASLATHYSTFSFLLAWESESSYSGSLVPPLAPLFSQSVGSSHSTSSSSTLKRGRP